MLAKANKTVLRQVVEEIYNQANIELTGKYFDQQ